MAEEVRLTKAGKKELEDRLDYLIKTSRKEITEAIAVARSFGDLSENGEYDVLLSVTDRGTPILSLSMPVPSSELAARLTARWEQKGAEVYQELIRLMTGQEEL